MKISQKVKMAVAGLAVVLAGVMATAPAMAFTNGSWYANKDGSCQKYDSGTGGNSTTMTTANNWVDKAYSSSTECYAAVASGDTEDSGLMGILQGVLNGVFGVIGFIAVIMLVYGGIQYTISSGDAGKVKKAKDTILYGIVGLIVSLLAAAIVNFVLVNILKK